MTARGAWAGMLGLALMAGGALATPPDARGQGVPLPECLSTGAGTDRRFDWGKLDAQQRSEACGRAGRALEDAQRLRPSPPPPIDPLRVPPGATRPPGSLPAPGAPPGSALAPIAPVLPPRAPGCRAADCISP